MKKFAWSFFLVSLTIAAIFAFRILSDRGRLTSDPIYTDLARVVFDNELVSHRDPKVALKFDLSFRYLGGQKFVLYGVADAEQHFFAEFDADDQLTSLYWVQFEEYLPENSYKYDYDDSPAKLQLGGIDFVVDTAPVRPNPKNRRRGSDGSLARQLLRSKGYSLPDEFAYARLVHLTDATRRKELMIISIDKPVLHELHAEDLKENGKDAQSWPAIEKAHLDKIRRTLTLISNET